MKPGSIFVNTARYVPQPRSRSVVTVTHTCICRGGLVDEAALLDALDSGKLHGVGLDVYADEPRINSELFKHPNVTLLPHMGTE
jgi:phosphoglycerate dehydrogenase-like enzyme